MEALQAFVGSNELKEAMKSTVVLEAPHTLILNEIAAG
jgi:hypothetical protein